MSELEELLVSGSDPRLAVDAVTGLNRFGCAPGPRPDALRFGSSTASSISPEAFTHVGCEHERLREERCLDTPLESVRRELVSLLDLAGTGTEIVFSPSGTDSALHALFLVRTLTGEAALDCLLTASDETGSGVPLAVSGRHFSARTAEGVFVTPGEAIAGLGEGVRLISLPRRSAQGILRPPACLDQDVWEAVERSAEAGRHVLLQVMDSSKLGAAGPSAECLRRLASRFAGSIHFVVDACQMRLSRACLREHLAQGHLVLVSGSKFFTGPPFSGALLVPACHSKLVQTAALSASCLRDYTSRCAWPQSWPAVRASLPDRVSLGQYLRWSAALFEMQAYYSVPTVFREQALERFAALTTMLIRNCGSDLRLLDDAPLSAAATRTIFPFLVRHGSGWLSYAESVTLYQWLNKDCADVLPVSLSVPEKALASALCHIGQPVRIPLRDGRDAGALRISADARMISQLWSRHQADPGDGLARLEQQVGTVLAKTALIARHL